MIDLTKTPEEINATLNAHHPELAKLLGQSSNLKPDALTEEDRLMKRMRRVLLEEKGYYRVEDVFAILLRYDFILGKVPDEDHTYLQHTLEEYRMVLERVKNVMKSNPNAWPEGAAMEYVLNDFRSAMA